LSDKGSETIAPADARPHAPWPMWRKVLAYVLLMALSLGAIWLVDVKVHRPQVQGDGSLLR
jgi:hypothetical protein